MSKNNNNRPNNKPINTNASEPKVEETKVDTVPVEEPVVQDEKVNEEPVENVEVDAPVEVPATEETAVVLDVKVDEIPEDTDIVDEKATTSEQYIISIGKNLSDEKITLICDRLFKAGISLKYTESGEYAVGPFNSKEEAINERKNMYRVGVKGSIKEF